MNPTLGRAIVCVTPALATAALVDIAVTAAGLSLPANLVTVVITFAAALRFMRQATAGRHG